MLMNARSVNRQIDCGLITRKPVFAFCRRIQLKQSLCVGIAELHHYTKLTAGVGLCTPRHGRGQACFHAAEVVVILIWWSRKNVLSPHPQRKIAALTSLLDRKQGQNQVQ